MTPDIDHRWKEARLEERTYFCKVVIQGRVLFGTANVAGRFGCGTISIPLEGGVLAKYNKPRFGNLSVAEIYTSLGLRMGEEYGQAECEHTYDPEKGILALRISRTKPEIREHREGKQTHMNDADVELKSLEDLIGYLQTKLPGVAIQFLSSQEYPSETFNPKSNQQK